MNIRPTLLAAWTLAAMTSTLNANAKSDDESPQAVLLKNSEKQSNQWNGIGKITRNNTLNCTATLLDTRDPENGRSGPAYVLTAGHCLSVSAGTKTGVPFDASIQFNYFADTAGNSKSYPIHKANWVSLASTDLAVLELTTPLETLMHEGINPIRIASNHPLPGKVNIIHAPNAPEPSTLLLSSCNQERADDPLLGAAVLTEYIRQNCKGINSGSSGAPSLDAISGELIGILSATTYGLSVEQVCWLGVCLGDKVPLVSPAEAVHSPIPNFLAGCFSNGNFDTTKKACTVEPNFNFERKNWELPSTYWVPTFPKTVPGAAPSTWNVSFSMSTPFYRFKPVRNAKDCYSPYYYSDIISTDDALINAPIENVEGLHFLCIVGVESAEQKPDPGLLRNTQIFPTHIVERDLTRIPEPNITFQAAELDGKTYVHAKWAVGSSMNRTQYYFGPTDETHCADIPVDKFKSGSGVLLGVVALPQTLCTYSEDWRLRTSEVRTDIVTPDLIRDSAP